MSEWSEIGKNWNCRDGDKTNQVNWRDEERGFTAGRICGLIKERVMKMMIPRRHRRRWSGSRTPWTLSIGFERERERSCFSDLERGRGNGVQQELKTIGVRFYLFI